tara:strand:+ start:11352 stop:11780 length:429 start_codon:yes stop_codon:yes gene_type:complete
MSDFSVIILEGITEVLTTKEEIIVEVSPQSCTSIEITQKTPFSIEIATRGIQGIQGIQGNSYQESYESVSKNIKSWSFTLNYISGSLNTITYVNGANTITKTFNYTLGELTSIVLSGDTPSGIDLTKTLNYTTGNLTGVAYA